MRPNENAETMEAPGNVRKLATTAGELVESASGQVKEYAEKAAVKAKEILHEANNASMADVEKKVGDYVRVHPGTTLLAAAAIGFVAGILVSRR